MKTLSYIAGFAVLAFIFSQCSKETSSMDSFSGTGIAGSTSRFTISGDHLYTVDTRDLNIFSIADPAQLSKVATHTVGSDIETIFSREKTLFVGSQSAMYIIDVTQPAFPVQRAEVSHVMRSCDPVVADSAYAFVTLRTGNTCSRGVNRLDIVDVRNLSNVSIVKSYTNFSAPKGLAIDGNWLFVCDNGIRMFDRRNINSLAEKVPVQGIPANDVIADNGVLIVSASDGIYQYNYAAGQLQFRSKIFKTL